MTRPNLARLRWLARVALTGYRSGAVLHERIFLMRDMRRGVDAECDAIFAAVPTEERGQA